MTTFLTINSVDLLCLSQELSENYKLNLFLSNDMGWRLCHVGSAYAVF